MEKYQWRGSASSQASDRGLLGVRDVAAPSGKRNLVTVILKFAEYAAVMLQLDVLSPVRILCLFTCLYPSYRFVLLPRSFHIIIVSSILLLLLRCLNSYLLG